MARDVKLDAYVRNIVLVDLDGTICHKPRDLEHFARFKKGALNSIRKIKKLGFEVVLYTARSNLGPVEKFVASTPLRDLVVRVTNKKENAILFIDDRGYRFNGDWVKEMQEIEEILKYHLLMSKIFDNPYEKENGLRSGLL